MKQLELSFVSEPTPVYAEVFIQGPSRIRKLSYLTSGTPRLIIEGKWMTKQYGLRPGDYIFLKFYPDRIIIKFR